MSPGAFAVLADSDADAPGAALLGEIVDYGIALGFDPDAFVYELVDGIIGDHYPGPDRICVHAEQILREYLADELCSREPPPPGRSTSSRSRAAPRRSATSSTRSRPTSCSSRATASR